MPDMSGLMQRMGSLTIALTAIPFVIIVLVFLGLALRTRRKISQSQNWQRAMGSVQFSGVDMRRSSNGRGGSSTAYYPEVTYVYRVDGKDYTNNRIQFGTPIGYGWAGKAQKLADSYPVGKNVEVFYNPNDPYEAVLERKSSSSTAFVGIALFILLILGCTVAFSAGMLGFVQNILNTVNINLPR
jgi:hypothetical protein